MELKRAAWLYNRQPDVFFTSMGSRWLLTTSMVSLLWRVGGLWLRRVETQDTTEQTCHHPVVQEGTIVLSCCAFRFLNNFSLLVLNIISLFVIPLDRMKPRNVFLRFFVVPDPTSLNSSRPQNCDPCHALRFGDPLGLCQKKLGFAEGLSIEWHQA